MRYFKELIMVILSVLLAENAFSQEKSVFEVSRLTDHIYKLSTDGGGYTVKVIASIGDDGILIVDSGQKETAEDLKKAIYNLGKGIPKFIISTHAHVEHIGGNAIFGKEPIIIGHKNLRTRLRSGSYLFDEFPDETLPEITITDSLSLHFNGEEIKIISFPGCHDDNDVIIWFTKSKIVCVGGISNGLHFPSVDSAGDVLKYREIVQKVIDMLPDDVTIIPGHGEDGTMDDLRAFHEMLVKTTEIVRGELEQGKNLDTLQKENILEDWGAFECSYVDKNQWIKYLVQGFQDRENKKSIYEPMYYAIKDRGADAAIEHYYELKNNFPDKYGFKETDLAIIGYKLMGSEKRREAVKFFERYVKDNPQGIYIEFGYNSLGELYNYLGDKESALINLKKCLELNPENTQAAEMIKEIEKE